jgi:hypothetical protein
VAWRFWVDAQLSAQSADIRLGLGIESPETVIAMTSVAVGVVLLALSIVVLVWGFPSLPPRDD